MGAAVTEEYLRGYTEGATYAASIGMAARATTERRSAILWAIIGVVSTVLQLAVWQPWWAVAAAIMTGLFIREARRSHILYLAVLLELARWQADRDDVRTAADLIGVPTVMEGRNEGGDE